MCRTYGSGSRLYTRACYRTGRAGARFPGDARGANGHVPRQPGTPSGQKAGQRRAPQPCRLCEAPWKRLDDKGRCPECLIEIVRGDRSDREA